MEHSYFKDRISAYHDGELKHEEARMMAEHLETCAECRQLLGDLEKLDRMVEKHSGLAESDYWEESARKIEAALSTEATPTEIIPVKSKWTGMGWKLVAVAASLSVLTFIALHEGEISKTIKAPVQAESPRVRALEPPSVDSFIGDKVDLAEKTQPIEEETEVAPMKIETPAPEPEEEQKKVPVGYLQREGNETEDKAVPELLEPPVTGDEPVSDTKPDASRLGVIEEKVKELGADSEFPATQLVQSVPAEIRRGKTSRVVEDTTESAEHFEYDLADEAPSAPKPLSLKKESLAETKDALEQLRQKRDSLQSVISAKKSARATATARGKTSVTTSTVPLEIAPSFKGADSIDKDELQDTVGALSRELERSDPVLKLLETHYEIARLTDDRREYEKSVDFLKSYLDKEDSSYKLQAAWYLQRLGETD